jgi:ferredoxin
MRVILDQASCDLQGLCVSICPEVFDYDDEDQVKVVDPEPEEALRAKVQEAADSCPKYAIEITG